MITSFLKFNLNIQHFCHCRVLSSDIFYRRLLRQQEPVFLVPVDAGIIFIYLSYCFCVAIAACSKWYLNLRLLTSQNHSIVLV